MIVAQYQTSNYGTTVVTSDEFTESMNFRMFALNWYYDQITNTDKDTHHNMRCFVGLVHEEAEVC